MIGPDGSHVYVYEIAMLRASPALTAMLTVYVCEFSSHRSSNAAGHCRSFRGDGAGSSFPPPSRSVIDSMLTDFMIRSAPHCTTTGAYHVPFTVPTIGNVVSP